MSPPHAGAGAQRSYGCLIRWYGLLEGGGEQRIARLAIEALSVHPGERAVEIGPGTGQGVCALATAAGAAGVVCAVDLVPRMIARTRDRAQRERPPVGLVLACGDGVHLPLRSAVAEAVFMSFALELFDTPEIPLVLGECQRVLRPGGRLGVVSLSRLGGLRWTTRLYEWG